jgi:hypothetical protein
MATTDEKRHWTPGSNFPGLKLGTVIAESWLRLLTDQASLFNDAWRQVKDGSFGFGDYARSAASLWESYLRAIADVVRTPFQGGAAPQWVNFVYDKEKPALKRTVSLPGDLGESVQLAVTPLHALGSSEIIPASVVSASFPSGNLRHDTLEVMIDDPRALPRKDGEYIGFVYDRRSQGGPPLVVILLTISHGG